MRVVLSSDAEADLIAIWRDTYVRWGADQADFYIDHITATVAKLEHHPELGAKCDAIRAGYRRLIVGQHCAFYRLSAARIEIIRVLHERMDATRQLEE